MAKDSVEVRFIRRDKELSVYVDAPVKVEGRKLVDGANREIATMLSMTEAWVDMQPERNHWDRFEIHPFRRGVSTEID